MTKAVQAEEVLGEHLRAAWVRRRPAWTRTDTARWLSDRSPLVLAWLRRTDPAHAPAFSSRMGRWLQEERPALFTSAHKKLAAAAVSSPAAVDALDLRDLLS